MTIDAIKKCNVTDNNNLFSGHMMRRRNLKRCVRRVYSNPANLLNYAVVLLFAVNNVI